MPHDLRYSFKWYTYPLGITIPPSEWLEYKLQVQGDHTDYTHQSKQVSLVQRNEIRRDSKQTRRPTAILLETEKSKATLIRPADQHKPVAAKGERRNAYCPYCDSNRHFLNNCENLKLLAKEQKVTWIKSQNRCWRCGRGHQAAHYILKALCQICNRKHLVALHEVNDQSRTTEEYIPASAVLYVDRPACDPVESNQSSTLKWQQSYGGICCA